MNQRDFVTLNLALFLIVVSLVGVVTKSALPLVMLLFIPDLIKSLNTLKDKEIKEEVKEDAPN